MTETPLSAALGLLLFALLVMLVAAVIANLRWPKNARPVESSTSAAGRVTIPQVTCSVQNCGRAATTTVRAGLDNWTMCGRCAEEYQALEARWEA